MNEKLIKDLREGRCAVKNDGTYEQLEQILSHAFPKDPDHYVFSGVVTYYFASGYDNNKRWASSNETPSIKCYSVKDFFTTTKYTIEEINGSNNILIIIKSIKEFDKLKSLGINLSKKYCGHYYHKPYNGATFNDDLDFNELPWSNYIVLTYSDIIMQEKAEFKKGDYIVTLKVSTESNTNCAKNNYCFKQRIDSKSIAPEIDLNGYALNENELLSFNKQESLINWRYATQEEIGHYDKIDEPYDVTTLIKTFPRVMLMSDFDDIKTAYKRVVFMFKCNKYLTWSDAETIEEAEKKWQTKSWNYAWELDELKSIFPFSLSPNNAQSIIDIACVLWKSKLANKWGSDIVQGRSIDITEEDYNTMYDACTPKQKELFDKIFILKN